MSNPPLQPEAVELSAKDAEALEALLGAGLVASELPEGTRARGERVWNLLSVLSCGCAFTSASRALLVDVTMIRVERAARRPESQIEPMLTPTDADALDALAQAGFVPRDVPHALDHRAERLDALGRLLSAGIGGAWDSEMSQRRDRRIEAIMSRVEATVLRTHKLDEARGRGWAFPLVRMREFAAVAAALVLLVSVVWPVVATAGGRMRRASCEANMGSIASAISRYANDHADALPIVSASFGGMNGASGEASGTRGSWWNVTASAPKANSANLFALARQGYAKVRELACAGNPGACMDEACAPRCFDWKSLEEVSFSYQIVAGERVARLSEPGRRVVLADRSPVVPKARAGLAIDPLENSANHARRGQNVLFTDGSVEWFTTPMRSNQDNIWLPASRPHQGALFLTDIGIVSITIHGNEIPRTPDDAFVGP